MVGLASNFACVHSFLCSYICFIKLCYLFCDAYKTSGFTPKATDDCLASSSFGTSTQPTIDMSTETKSVITSTSGLSSLSKRHFGEDFVVLSPSDATVNAGE